MHHSAHGEESSDTGDIQLDLLALHISDAPSAGAIIDDIHHTITMDARSGSVAGGESSSPLKSSDVYHHNDTGSSIGGDGNAPIVSHTHTAEAQQTMDGTQTTKPGTPHHATTTHTPVDQQHTDDITSDTEDYDIEDPVIPHRGSQSNRSTTSQSLLTRYRYPSSSPQWITPFMYRMYSLRGLLSPSAIVTLIIAVIHLFVVYNTLQSLFPLAGVSPFTPSGAIAYVSYALFLFLSLLSLYYSIAIPTHPSDEKDPYWTRTCSICTSDGHTALHSDHSDLPLAPPSADTMVHMPRSIHSSHGLLPAHPSSPQSSLSHQFYPFTSISTTEMGDPHNIPIRTSHQDVHASPIPHSSPITLPSLPQPFTTTAKPPSAPSSYLAVLLQAHDIDVTPSTLSNSQQSIPSPIPSPPIVSSALSPSPQQKQPQTGVSSPPLQHLSSPHHPLPSPPPPPSLLSSPLPVPSHTPQTPTNPHTSQSPTQSTPSLSTSTPHPLDLSFPHDAGPKEHTQPIVDSTPQKALHGPVSPPPKQTRRLRSSQRQPQIHPHTSTIGNTPRKSSSFTWIHHRRSFILLLLYTLILHVFTITLAAIPTGIALSHGMDGFHYNYVEQPASPWYIAPAPPIPPVIPSAPSGFTIHYSTDTPVWFPFGKPTPYPLQLSFLLLIISSCSSAICLILFLWHVYLVIAHKHPHIVSLSSDDGLDLSDGSAPLSLIGEDASVYMTPIRGHGRTASGTQHHDLLPPDPLRLPSSLHDSRSPTPLRSNPLFKVNENIYQTPSAFQQRFLQQQEEKRLSKVPCISIIQRCLWRLPRVFNLLSTLWTWVCLPYRVIIAIYHQCIPTMGPHVTLWWAPCAYGDQHTCISILMSIITCQWVLSCFRSSRHPGSSKKGKQKTLASAIGGRGRGRGGIHKTLTRTVNMDHDYSEDHRNGYSNRCYRSICYISRCRCLRGSSPDELIGDYDADDIHSSELHDKYLFTPLSYHRSFYGLRDAQGSESVTLPPIDDLHSDIPPNTPPQKELQPQSQVTGTSSQGTDDSKAGNHDIPT